MDLRDLAVHLVRDGAVARMALAPRAQLDELHRLARVEVEHETDSVAQTERVGRLAIAAFADQALPLAPGDVERVAVGVAATRGLDLLGHAGAEVRRQPLPLD